MAIALRSQGTVVENTVAATTLNVPYPSPVSSVDMMVLFASVNTAALIGLPSGWTSVHSGSGTGNTLAPSLLVAIKQATGSETGSLAVTTASAVSIGQIIAFSGVDLNTPQDVAKSSVDNTTASGTTIIPTLTTTTPGAALIYAAAIATTAVVATPPSAPATFTETADRVSGTRSATMGYLIWASSGATGSVTVAWVGGTAKSSGAVLALRPGVTAQPLRPRLQAVARSANW